MLSVKIVGINYHFFSLWYDATWDWTQVSQSIGEYSNHYTIMPIYQTNDDTLIQIIKKNLMEKFKPTMNIT